MPKIEFKKLIDSPKYAKDGYYLRDVGLRYNGEKAHRTFLLDTGASWITVSKVVAKQLGIDLKAEENGELRRLWTKYGSDNPHDFIHTTWNDYEAKAIPITSTLANGENLESYLYPIEIELQQDFSFITPVNILDSEIDTHLFGIRPILDLANHFETNSSGSGVDVEFDDERTILQNLGDLKK